LIAYYLLPFLYGTPFCLLYIEMLDRETDVATVRIVRSSKRCGSI
jgi:hypothetical protein